MSRVRAQPMARLGFCEVRIRAQPGPRIALVFLLCRWLSGPVTDLPSSAAPPSGPPWISHLQGEDGVSWSSPKPTAATFLLGPMGFPCWGVTETKGASPSYTLPPQPCACTGPPGTNSQGSISTGRGTMQKATGGEGKGRAACTCLSWISFLCSAPQWWQPVPPHPKQLILLPVRSHPS